LNLRETKEARKFMVDTLRNFKEEVKSIASNISAQDITALSTSPGPSVILSIGLPLIGVYLAKKKHDSALARKIARFLGADVNSVNEQFVFDKLNNPEYYDELKKNVLTVITERGDISPLRKMLDLTEGEAWEIFNTIKDIIFSAEVLNQFSIIVPSLMSIKEEYTQGQKDLMITQYSKLSDDWRHFNTIIWGVPSVAIAIMTGVILVAYSPDLEGWPRITTLSVGSLFLFALTIELVKKRLHMNAISYLLKDLQVALGIPEDLRFPLGTKSSEIEDVIDKSVEKVQKSLDYYKAKPPDYKDALFMLFQKSYARKYLTYVTFVAAVAVALLSVIEIGVMISRHSTQG
jgi:hypothetical protein